jgi:selenide, water dikinase
MVGTWPLPLKAKPSARTVSTHCLPMIDPKSIRLTTLSSCAGCAAKLGQGVLSQVLAGLPMFPNPALMIGSATGVQTIDFFTPIVDDAYTYGQIAATNSLSDVYAMGGQPLTAMNVLGIPEELPLEIAHEILRGGADKLMEAKCVLAGGHSIKNLEPVYGLSVTGMVHPDRVISNAGAQVGDVLILTKPLGTGIASTAMKRQVCGPALAAAAIRSMTTLNTPGTRIAQAGLVKAGTDVTGFGLLGHLGSLCKASGVSAEIRVADLPLLDPEVISLIESGVVPGGTKTNLEHVSQFTDMSQVSSTYQVIAADAQTSGGLLLCVPPANVDAVLAILTEEATLTQAIVGSIISAEAYRVRLV